MIEQAFGEKYAVMVWVGKCFVFASGHLGSINTTILLLISSLSGLAGCPFHD